MISKGTQVKLRRMSELQAVIERDADEDDEGLDAYFAEFRTLQDEVMPEVQAVVRLLVKARILTMVLEIRPETLANLNNGDYESVTFEVRDWFINGGVWLEVEPFVSGGIHRDREGT